MGSSSGNCEIVEVKDGPSTTWQTFHTDREQRPPISIKRPNKSLEDDINKLFEAVTLRTSKSMDLSETRRNPSKKPMRPAGSYSPGTGFSGPITLKQSLRGLCISQAAEMAAMKRLSMPASPRVSANLYRSVVGEPSGSGEFKTGSSAVSEESSSCTSETLPMHSQESPVTSVTESLSSPPCYIVKPNVKTSECLPSESSHQLVQSSGYNIIKSLLEGETSSLSASYPPQHLQKHNTNPSKQSANTSPHLPVSLHIKDIMSGDDTQSVETVWLQQSEHNLVSPLPPHNAFDNALNLDKNVSVSNKVVNDLNEDSVTSLKADNKETPKQRRKSRIDVVPSSSAVKGKKDVKPTRTTPRVVKPVIRNKNVVIKKSKRLVVSTGGNAKASSRVNGPDHSSGELICQRCQCSLRDTNKDSGEIHAGVVGANELADTRDCDVNKAECIPANREDRGTPVVKTGMNFKSSEKGDISQSSKSSDFGSSTTSLSEDSNLSGSTWGNKPHMSRDMRWGAINRVIKQYGFLGLSHFNLLKKLGSGDIGTVYLAELIGTNCPFAIKVMDNEFLSRRKKLPRAQTEREILRMLDHPFLPTLYAQFTSDNLSCLVMEFCPGGDLHVLRQRQPGRYFPEQAARFYVAEVLLALEYLHMLGIVYRDLKPENILVREDGHIMLTDFDLSLRCSVSPMLVNSSSMPMEPPRISGPCAGSNCIDPFCSGPSCKMSCFSPRIFPASARARKLKANAAAQGTSLPQLVAEPTEARSNSFVGTHEYLAPEIIKGEGHGSAVDWWTLGVFLYELLYGKTPFKGAGNDETLDNVVLQNLRFPDRPIVSFQARDLIRGLLVKEPENRFGTETGAAEIKRHSFFEGLNWALIRCAVPPQIPELVEVGYPQMVPDQENGVKFMEYSADGEHLEFELF